MDTSTKLPAGWRVEMLGLIEAVQFTHTDGRTLLWGDNEWRMGTRSGMFPRPIPHFPPASTMAEARKVGTAWLNEVEATADV